MPDTFLRAFPATLQLSGQRQLTGRLVPYDSPTDVLDMIDGKPEVYREGFRRGAFASQAGSGEKGVLRRIAFIHKHDGGLGYLGPFTALRDEEDGLWGDVAILRSKAADVEDLLAAGVDELSVEFRLPGARAGNTAVDDDGVRWRTRAHLDAVALEPKGAYSGARVAAFRAEQDALLREQSIVETAVAAEQVAEQAAATAAAAQVAAANAEAAAVAERRRRFELLADRLPKDLARQHDYVRSFGLMKPPHEGVPRFPY